MQTYSKNSLTKTTLGFLTKFTLSKFIISYHTCTQFVPKYILKGSHQLKSLIVGRCFWTYTHLHNYTSINKWVRTGNI